MLLDRRAFISSVGSAALVAWGRPEPARRLSRIGLQLYTVREEMQRDMPGTLARISNIGYRDVEFAGYFGRTPAEIRALLARYKLRAPSTHVDFPEPGPKWTSVLADAAAIGHTYVTVGWIPEAQRRSVDEIRRVADQFNRAAREARAHDLRFAYHNHDFDFRPVQNQVPLNVLLEHTDLALVQFELDVYWVTKAGADPQSYLAQYPSRFTMLHAKDASPAPERAMVDVGRGTIDFRRILARDAETGRHLQHVFVEHDQPANALQSIRASFDYLSRLEF